MQRVLCSYSCFTTYAAVQATLGSLCAFSGYCVCWCLVAPVIFGFILALTVWRGHLNKLGTSCCCLRCSRLVPKLLLFLLSWLAIAFFIYSGFRTQAVRSPLSDLLGRRILFAAKINAVDSDDRLTLDVSKVLFPQQRTVGLHLSAFLTPQAKKKSGVSVGQICVFDARIDEARQNCRPELICRIYGLQLCPGPEQSSLAARGRSVPGTFDSEQFAVRCQRSVDHIRRCMVQEHSRNLGTTMGPLLSSMVIGGKAVNLDAALTQKFRDVGLSHILAASGFNLTIVTTIAYLGVRSLCKQSMVVSFACLVAACGFTVLAGVSASVVRAALMCCLVLATRLLSRSPDLLAVLSAALLITLTYDPVAITDVGLQLSYGATIAILLLAKPLTARIYHGQNTLLKGIAEAIAVVLSSQAGILPVQLFHFQQAGLMFLPANLLVSPLIAPITVFGFASSVVSVVAAAGPEFIKVVGLLFSRALDLSAYCPLRVLLAVVEIFDRVGGNLTFPQPSPLVVAIYYLALCFWISAMTLGRFALIALLCYACALSGLLWRSPLQDSLIAVIERTVIVANRNRAAIAISFDESSKDRNRRKFLATNGLQLVDCWSLVSLNPDAQRRDFGSGQSATCAGYRTPEKVPERSLAPCCETRAVLVSGSRRADLSGVLERTPSKQRVECPTLNLARSWDAKGANSARVFHPFNFSTPYVTASSKPEGFKASLLSDVLFADRPRIVCRGRGYAVVQTSDVWVVIIAGEATEIPCVQAVDRPFVVIHRGAESGRLLPENSNHNALSVADADAPLLETRRPYRSASSRLELFAQAFKAIKAFAPNAAILVDNHCNDAEIDMLSSCCRLGALAGVRIICRDSAAVTVVRSGTVYGAKCCADFYAHAVGTAKHQTSIRPVRSGGDCHLK